MTGESTRLVTVAPRALRVLNRSNVPFAIIGATALGVRGLPRFTANLDVVVLPDDAEDAMRALDSAGMLQGPVDLVVASAEPESTVVAEATSATVFGVDAPVATLEQLVLMYLYSNQVRHAGDLARIVVETSVDLAAVERYLAEVHPEMLSVLRERVASARNPAPAQRRPPRRPR